MLKTYCSDRSAPLGRRVHPAVPEGETMHLEFNHFATLDIATDQFHRLTLNCL